MTELEYRIRAMTVPRNGYYPRPWMTDTDPAQADVCIVGASSAKTFRAADVGPHDRFLDALWNRNGQTCRAMYDAATTKPSRTRPNLDRLSEMLSAHGLLSLQTNVTCASAPYDAQISVEDRAHGTELFLAVVAHVPWKVMIIYGKGACERFGRAFGTAMPAVPSPESLPVQMTLQGRPVFLSPTLAPPSYRTTVWPYLQRVVAAIAEGEEATGMRATQPPSLPATHTAPMNRVPREIVPPDRSARPEASAESAPNRLVSQRMQAIAAMSGLKIDSGTYQTSLSGGPELSSTDRVFRHKFKTAMADILVREDVFLYDTALRDAAAWTAHKTAVFQNIRTADLRLLDRILDAVEAFAARTS